MKLFFGKKISPSESSDEDAASGTAISVDSDPSNTLLKDEFAQEENIAGESSKNLITSLEADHPHYDEISSQYLESEQRVIESNNQLEAASKQLQQEISERKQAEQELWQLNTELEKRLSQKSEEVEAANKQLQQEISKQMEIQEQLQQLTLQLNQNKIETAAQIEAANQQLQQEISERTSAYGQVRQLSLEMNQRVMESALQLENFHKQLQQEINQRIRIEREAQNMKLALEQKPVETAEPGEVFQQKEEKQQTSDYIQQQELLDLSQKMADIERLSSETAHEFNNLLKIIAGNTEIILSQLHESDPLRPPIEEVKQAGESAATLTRQLLSLGSKQIPEPKALDLNEPVTKANETILLVENEELLRNLISKTLDEIGYRVLKAENGSEALFICQQHAGSIALVLSEAVLPGISGPDLLDQLKYIRPKMKVLYLSDNEDRSIFKDHSHNSHWVLLQKPFTPEELTQKVRETLDN